MKNCSRMENKLNILISAYACEPHKGSEPAVGWNLSKQISRYHNVWIITRENNRTAIEDALAIEPLPNANWIYYDLPKWLSFWKRGGRGVHLYYYIWQAGIYFSAKKFVKNVKIDIIQHVTFVNYWMPSFLSLLKIPFIWGPVGGGETTPRIFYKYFSIRGRIYEYLRDIVRWIAEKDIFVKQTARNAVLVLATTKDTYRKLNKLGTERVKIFSQIAFDKADYNQIACIKNSKTNNYKILSIGRLLHWKGFQFGIYALEKFLHNYPNAEYAIIGDGPEKNNLKKLISNLGLESRVKIINNIPRKELLCKLPEYDVLLHPSFHESGGLVCIEAMAAGLPVICLNLGGPGEIVTGETGIKINARDKNQIIDDISDALLKLATDKELYDKKSKACRELVYDRYLWERKADILCKLYKEILDKNK